MDSMDIDDRPPVAPSQSSKRGRSAPYGIEVNVDEEMNVDTVDCHRVMKRKEKCSGILYNPAAKYLKYRRVLVDWMCEMGDELRLHNSTIHVAVMYLDRVLQSVLVARDSLQLVAINCILIAAKYEEAEADVPSFHELNECSGSSYSDDIIQEMEMQILNRLGWHLSAMTPIHFLSYYLCKGTLFENDLMQGMPMVEKLPRYMRKYCDFFADLCLQEYRFQKPNASVVAASIIKASRKALEITPLWRPELEDLTGYSEADFEECFDELWSHYVQNFPVAVEKRKESPTSVDAF